MAWHGSQGGVRAAWHGSQGGVRVAVVIMMRGRARGLDMDPGAGRTWILGRAGHGSRILGRARLGVDPRVDWTWILDLRVG